jgi:hypothetical protein
VSVEILVHPAFFNAVRCLSAYWSSVDTRA